MRKIPEMIGSEGLLVGWSLEPVQRKTIIGFSQDSSASGHPAISLEPILDTGEGHLITVAPTGSGKGTGCIIPALLRYEGPVIVVDPKGENYAVTAQRRRDMGQEVLLLDPFNITESEERHSFNPLDMADPGSDRFVEDVATLTSLISVPHESVSGDFLFWDNMGKSLITAAIMDVLTMSDSDESTLASVRNLVNSSLQTLQSRAEKWKESGIPELKRLASLLLNPADETIGGYVAHAMRQLDFLKGEQVEQHFTRSDIDLNKIYDGSPLTLYLVLPADKLESHSALLRLWIGVFISIITRRKTQPVRSTLFIVDEAAQLGTLPQLRQAITLLRGFGVRVWSFWQDISQLKNLYPRDWETIVNNCRIQQYFGATTGIAADAVSIVSGFGDRDEIMDLESDEMILNIPGDEPVIAAKPNYLRDTVFSGLYNANPYYAVKENPRDEPLRTRPVFRKTCSPAAKHRTRTLRQDLILSKGVFLPVSEANWELVGSPERETRLKTAGIESEEFINDSRTEVRRCTLPFYKDFDWFEISTTRKSPGEHAYYLMNDSRSFHLSGASSSIYEVNEQDLLLTESNIILYLTFFCSNLCCDEGRFLILNHAGQLDWVHDPDPEYLKDLQKQILPPRIIDTPEKTGNNTWVIQAHIAYGSNIFSARMSISKETGEILMDDDEPLSANLPIMEDNKRLEYIGRFDEGGTFFGIR